MTLGQNSNRNTCDRLLNGRFGKEEDMGHWGRSERTLSVSRLR